MVRWFLPGCAGAAALLGASPFLSRPTPSPRPLRRAYWYWHHPFRLTAAEIGQLRRSRIERLFVHAGTLTRRAGRLALVSRQNWPESSPVQTHGVFRVDPSALKLLLEPDGAHRAAHLVRAARLPAWISGIQWDADVPTASLAAYGRFLSTVRREISSGMTLSATALPDWMRSPRYREVCDALDEIAPQFYANGLAEEGREPPALWEAETLHRSLARATAGRACAWIGLPAYGRCLILDTDGRSMGVRHDIDPDSLLSEPGWEVVRARTRTGPAALPVEDQLALRTPVTAAAGGADVPPGGTLWFQWPRLDALSGTLSRLERERPDGVDGVCFFRWPVQGEPLSLSPVRPSPPDDRLHVKLERTEGGVRVLVSNPNGVEPILGHGLLLELEHRGASVESDVPLQWLRGEEPASALRADRVRLVHPLLRPGRSWHAATLKRTSGAIRARLTWTAPGGVQRVVSASTEVRPSRRGEIGKSREGRRG